jgi:hypothetical protein
MFCSIVQGGLRNFVYVPDGTVVKTTAVRATAMTDLNLLPIESTLMEAAWPRY